MKLLFDQNLSLRLAEKLSDPYPGSSHVSSAGLDRSVDEAVRAYAREKRVHHRHQSADFDELGQAHGHPPKVVRLRIGNRTTRQIEALLRDRRGAMLEPDRNQTTGTLGLVEEGRISRTYTRSHGA